MARFSEDRADETVARWQRLAARVQAEHPEHVQAVGGTYSSRLKPVSEQESRAIIGRLNERGIGQHLDIPPVGFSGGRFIVEHPPETMPCRPEGGFGIIPGTDADSIPALLEMGHFELPEREIWPGWHNEISGTVPYLTRADRMEFEFALELPSFPWSQPHHDIMADIMEMRRRWEEMLPMTITVDTEALDASILDAYRAIGSLGVPANDIRESESRLADSLLGQYVTAEEYRAQDQRQMDFYSQGVVSGFIQCDENGNIIKPPKTPEIPAEEKEQARLIRHNLLVDDPHPEDRSWWQDLYATSRFAGNVDIRWHTISCACEDCLNSDVSIDGFNNGGPRRSYYRALCSYDQESSAAPLMFKEIPEEYGRRP